MMEKTFFEILMKLEGNYSDDPMDRGGKTIYGVASRFHPSFFQKIFNLYKQGKLEESKQEAMLFYETVFYSKLHLDSISDPRIRYTVFDSAVNCGRKTAIRQLQYAINSLSEKENFILCDGIIGPKTIAAIDRISEVINNDTKLNDKFLQQLLASRIFYYTSRKQKVFLKGWLNRIARMLKLFNKYF